jgi:F-type H+-transporting ATPase subunit epsilon
MADRLTITLVTPTRRILERECDEVRAPGTLGYFGVRPGHEPLLTALDAGPLRIFDSGEADAYAIVGGFAEISDDKVLILADEAVHVDTIDLAHELAALEEARMKFCEVQEDLVQNKLEAARVKRHAARIATVQS